MRCDKCDAEVTEATVRSCWEDPHTPDHRGLCCRCFDVECGARPTVTLGLRTAAHTDLDDNETVLHYSKMF